MIIKKQMYLVRCDKCNKFFNNFDYEYNCFETKKELKEIIEDEDWQIKNKKIFCDECRTY